MPKTRRGLNRPTVCTCTCAVLQFSELRGLWKIPQTAGFGNCHASNFRCAIRFSPHFTHAPMDKRLKSTSFLTNNPVFLELCLQCDGQHEHLPWGIDMETQQFSTALEAEYPKCLCEAYATILFDLAQSQRQNSSSETTCWTSCTTTCS